MGGDYNQDFNNNNDTSMNNFKVQKPVAKKSVAGALSKLNNS